MTPFAKRNLLIAFAVFLFTGLIYGLNGLIPFLAGRIQHVEFIAISFIIMVSVTIMFFWSTLGVFGGLASFLTAMIFLYKSITALNPYYYSVLVMAFFLNSFIGYYIFRKINTDNQEYTVLMEKTQEDINLVNNHMEARNAEVAAMEKKVESLLKLKEIADSLSLSLQEEEEGIYKVISEQTFDVFGEDARVAIFIVDKIHKELNLSYVLKGKKRNPFLVKKGSIFDKWVLKNMKSLLVKDIKEDFRFSIGEDEKKDDAVSIIIKPLIVESSILGLVRVDSPDKDAFSQHELRILDIIGDLATVALENARLYQQTKELAIRDSLTGLYVHRYFMERLEEEVKRALHSNGKFAFLMFDIDNFKDFNDRYGHIPGDVVLKNIGQILKSRSSAGDIIARYGGEEFAFLAVGLNREEAMKLAHNIKNEIEKSPVIIRRQECFVTVSAGVAVFPEDAKLREDIIWEADKYLYEAKKKGKNAVCSK